MKYNLKYFNENKVIIAEDNYGGAYDLDGHRIAYSGCDRSMRYVFVKVDGVLVASRTTESKAISLALKYMNENF